jgi:hypothetical protein
MSVAGISGAAGAHTANHQTAHAPSVRPNNGRQTPSMTDIDAQGSSVASAPSSTGKIGSKVDIVA